VTNAGDIGWPHFELVTFPEPVGVPHDLVAPLIDKGVPRDLLGRYRAASELTLLQNAHLGRLICFGRTMQTDSMCFHPTSGAIFWIVDVPGGLEWLVNSRLEQFLASVKVVIERFPFYDVGSDLHLRERVGMDLTESISDIDPQALSTANGFWQTFIDDVVSGDFATQEVVA
jgi:hypothetical protein